MARAEVLLELGRAAEALDLLGAARARSPDNARAWTVAALAELREGRPADAADSAARAITLTPDSEWPHRVRSTALSAMARTVRAPTSQRLGREAVVAAGEAVRLAPYQAVTHRCLAQVLLSVRDIRGASLAANRAAQMAPGEAESWVVVSTVCIAANDWFRAEAAATRALTIDPGNYAANNNLAVALEQRGRFGKAVGRFTAAARTDPRIPTARNNVAGTGLRVLGLAAAVALLPVLLLPAGVFAYVGLLAAYSGLARSPRYADHFIRLGTRVALAIGRFRVPGGRKAILAGGASVTGAVVVVIVHSGAATVTFIMIGVLGLPILGLVAVERSKRRRIVSGRTPILVPLDKPVVIRSGCLLALAICTVPLALFGLAAAVAPDAQSRGEALGIGVGSAAASGAILRALVRRRRRYRAGLSAFPLP